MPNSINRRRFLAASTAGRKSAVNTLAPKTDWNPSRNAVHMNLIFLGTAAPSDSCVVQTGERLFFQWCGSGEPVAIFAARSMTSNRILDSLFQYCPKHAGCNS